MDLGAYANIENLSAIALANDIDVPRLRGYRLMAEEKPVSKEELDKEIRYQQLEEIRSMFQKTSPNCYEISRRTRSLIRKYMVI